MTECNSEHCSFDCKDCIFDDLEYFKKLYKEVLENESICC